MSNFRVSAIVPDGQYTVTLHLNISNAGPVVRKMSGRDLQILLGQWQDLRLIEIDGIGMYEAKAILPSVVYMIVWDRGER